MSAERTLTEVFLAERPRLVALAYRITGSRLDAEDIVQDAWLRAERSDWSSVERPEAWLTTVVSRLALDNLKSARRQREDYIGPWLPEPVVTTDRSGDPAKQVSADPAEVSELAESLTLGFLRLLESLGPLDRVVFVLAEVFDTPYQDIATTVGRTPEACRQIASRARRHVQSGGLDHDAPEAAEKVANDLAAAVVAGDVDQVVALLADDVVMVSDGGPGRRAARHPVQGSSRVARLLLNLAARALAEGREVDTSAVWVNNEPGGVVWLDGERYMTASLRVVDGLVREAYVVVNPDKLAALDIATPLV